MAMETTVTLLYFIPGKQGREDFHEQTQTEVGFNQTAHNLVRCFNDEVKANCQETLAVFTVKRASILGKKGKKMWAMVILIDFWGLDSIYLWDLPK